MDEGISIAKELKDRNALVLALNYAAGLAVLERDPLEVDRLASEMIALSRRNNFAYWLALGAIYRGWARSASGNTAEGESRLMIHNLYSGRLSELCRTGNDAKIFTQVLYLKVLAAQSTQVLRHAQDCESLNLEFTALI